MHLMMLEVTESSTNKHKFKIVKFDQEIFTELSKGDGSPGWCHDGACVAARRDRGAGGAAAGGVSQQS